MRTPTIALALPFALVVSFASGSRAAEPRDPFAAYTDDVICCFGPTPLEQVPLSAIKVEGIVVDTAAPRALVVHPDGTAHTIRVGSPLGRFFGRVAAINRNGVLVLEEFRDPITGKRMPQRTLLAVR